MSARPGDEPPFFLRPGSAHRSAVTLWNEDGVAGMPRRLRPGSVDVIVTSPPYNRGIPYAVYRDRLPREQYLGWMDEFAQSTDHVLAPHGSLFLNAGSPPRDPWFAWDVARRVAGRFQLPNVIHWIKSIAIDRRFIGKEAGVDRDLALGHYRPVSSSRFVHGAHEYVFHFTRNGRVSIDRLAIGVEYQDRSNVARWAGASRGLRCRGNTWFLPYSTIQDRARDRPHPATFPPELAEWCIRLATVRGSPRVVDPFAGIGSSALAAVRLGAPFTGFDIDRSYLTVARARLLREGRAGQRRARGDGSGRSRTAAGSTRASVAS